MNSRKAPLTTLASRLAFQVDRKILLLEEENFVRLDLSAHEHSGAAVLALPKPSILPSLMPSLSTAKQFVGAALIIYLILFAITNASAYSKIIMANVTNAVLAQEASIEPLQLSAVALDPWTGTRAFEHVEPERALEAFQGQPLSEDGLLSLNLVPTPYENRISIPSLNVNAPIVEPTLGVEALQAKDWGTLEDQIRSTLLQGVVHYPGTAEPGQTGNAFLTGHSSNVFWELSDYNTVFALLPQLEMGEDILINYKQKEYHYTVTAKREVTPDDVSILKQGNEKILTLVTCTPVGTTLKRLVVTAELVE